MVEADAEVVAELATQLGYPNEIEAIRRRIRPIEEADLIKRDGQDLLEDEVDALEVEAGVQQDEVQK